MWTNRPHLDRGIQYEKQTCWRQRGQSHLKSVSLEGDGPMQTIERPPEFSHDRRRFLGVAALSLAAMQLGPIGPAKAQGGPAKPARPAAIKPGTNTSFAALKQSDAGPLNVGYAEAGPPLPQPVVSLLLCAYSISPLSLLPTAPSAPRMPEEL